MNFYTVIFEYKGGTYIKQLHAISEIEALLKWSRLLDHRDIYGFGEKLKTKLQKQIEEDIKEGPPVALSGCKNVWCAVSISNSLINIVQTEK